MKILTKKFPKRIYKTIKKNYKKIFNKRTAWGAFGDYYKVSPIVGAKVVSRKKFAIKEFNLLKRAFKSKITPKPYGIINLKKSNYAIVMEHIKGKHLYDVNLTNKSKKIDRIINQLYVKTGILHKDQYDGNIIVRKNKLFIIDFTPSCCEVDK